MSLCLFKGSSTEVKKHVLRCLFLYHYCWNAHVNYVTILVHVWAWFLANLLREERKIGPKWSNPCLLIVPTRQLKIFSDSRVCFIRTSPVLHLYFISASSSTSSVLHLYFIYTAFVLYMYFICTSSVLHLNFIYTSSVLYLYIICTLSML